MDSYDIKGEKLVIKYLKLNIIGLLLPIFNIKAGGFNQITCFYFAIKWGDSLFHILGSGDEGESINKVW